MCMKPIDLATLDCSLLVPALVQFSAANRKLSRVRPSRLP